MNYKLFILLLFFASCLHSQKIDIATIEKQLDTITDVQSKLKLLIDVGTYYFDKDLKKSEKTFLKANSMVDGEDSINRGLILRNLGKIENENSNFSESYGYFNQAKEIFSLKKDTVNLAITLLELGYLHRDLAEHDKSFLYSKEALFLGSKIKDSIIMGRSYNAIGGFYRRIKKIDSSLINFKKSLSIFDKLENVEDHKCVLYNNLSILYSNQKKFEKATGMLKKGLSYQKRNNHNLRLSLAYHNLAVNFFKFKKYNIALKYCDSALFIANKEQFRLRITKAHKIKSQIYARIKDFENAHKHLGLYKIHSDSIFNNKTKEKIKELELKNSFALERKELDLITQKKESQKKFYFILSLLMACSTIIISFFVWKNKRASIKISQEKFEKEKLKKEILAQKIKASESELRSLIADNTMRLEFIKQLSKQIIIDKSSFKNKEIINYINSLVLKLQQQIATENKLSILQQKSATINQGFDEKLMKLYSELTKTEREVCSFMRLNLSIKEIASIRNASTDSIKAIRYRIRKKMKIKKNQELESFIQNLFT